MYSWWVSETSKLLFGVLSSVLSVIVFIPYYRDILRRKTQPHMYSWLVWGILQITGALAILKGGAGYGSWWLVVGAFFCLGIFVLSFKFGTKNVKRFDLYCLIAAVIAFAAYLFVQDPLYSVILVVIIDTVGFFPTFRKGYEEPHTETASLYVLSATTNLIGLLALQQYSLTTALYTSVLFVTNSIMSIILISRRRTM